MTCRSRTLVLGLGLAIPTLMSIVPRAQTPSSSGAPLTEVYRDDRYQLTGMTVSKTGRIFVSFPRWSDTYLNALVEVTPDGSARPYPDQRWNRWDQRPETAGTRFVCVQSALVDDTDRLWVLDPAAPMLARIVPGGPKLVEIDLTSNSVRRVIPFGSDVAPAGSYLNDLRVDTRRHTAYISDSGRGGIVVVDLSSGKARRILDGHASVMADDGVSLVIGGRRLVDLQGRPPRIHSDGIALSADGEYLYYQALTGRTLYRVKTSALRRGTGPGSSTGSDAAAAVEKVATTFPVDGLWMDARGRLYLSDLAGSAVQRLMADGTIERVAADPRLQWPDTFAEGPDGSIYVTTSRIHESAAFNGGKSARTGAYAVFKFTP